MRERKTPRIISLIYIVHIKYLTTYSMSINAAYLRKRIDHDTDDDKQCVKRKININRRQRKFSHLYEKDK